MAIAPIEFGKELRPSTIDALNKINEIITAVNHLDPSSIQTLKQNVGELQTGLQAANENISTNTGNISSLTSTSQSHTTDIDKIKLTLYTPLNNKE